MAKSKEKKKHPKPPEGVKSIEVIKKEIAARKEKLSKRKSDASKDGKLNKYDAKYRMALKRVKRAQRKLLHETYRIESATKVAAAKAAAAAPAEAPKAE